MRKNTFRKEYIFLCLFLIVICFNVSVTSVKAQTLNLQLSFSKASPVKVGDSITITSNSTGSSSPLYKFWIYDGVKWTVVQDYSEKNTYNWIPGRAAQYRIWVDAKDKSSTKERDTYKEVVYSVNSSVWLSSIDVSRPQPIPKDSSVEVKAAAVEGVDPIYRFWVYDGQAWKVIQDYSRKSSVMWKPVRTGAHRIWVDVKEASSLNEKDNYKEITYEINNGAQISDLSFSKASPAKIGDSITIGANSNGSNDALYKFWIYDGTSWIVAQDYSSNSTYNWVPGRAAQYRVWVDVKDKYSTKERDSYREAVYSVSSRVWLSSIDVSRPQPIPRDSSVEIKATAAEGVNPVYRFWIYDGQAWKVIQDYSSKSSVMWKPVRTGTHRIWVDVKEANSANEKDNYKEITYEVNDGAQIKDLAFSKASPVKVGESITITSSSNGSNSPLYKFWIYDGVKWIVVQDYSENNSYMWVPGHAAQYRIWVDVKDKYSSKERDSYKEVVYNAYSYINFSSITTSLNSPQNLGNNITVTANSESNENLLYRFWIYDGANWSIVRGYSSDKNYTWSPSKAGNYRIWVDVKAEGSLKDVDYSKEIQYVIENKPVIQDLTTNYPSPSRVNSVINVTAKVVYGENNLYRFWVYNGSTWAIVQNYSSNNVYVWNPKAEGNYRIWVDVKSANSGVDVQASKEILFDIMNSGTVYVDYNKNYADVSNIQMSVGAQTDKTGSWTSATKDDIDRYLNPANFTDDYGKYQFLRLNFTYGVSADDINKLLEGKGVLQGKGQVFLDAAKANNISPIYLVSHALLETGNGTSALAKGILVSQTNKLLIVADKDANGKIIGYHVEANPSPTAVEPKISYNVFGIRAYDYQPQELNSPDIFASEYAYSQGWNSIDDAIKYGAKWISDGYINSTTYAQNTLYEMRWNPQNPGTHQYASDVAWAYKQISNIKKLVDQCPNAVLFFEIPRYQSAPLSGKTIVLDAGHGGSDPGATANGYSEKNLNMQIVQKLGDRLKSLGANVLYTRQPSNDIYVSLQDRADFANYNNADLFLSIHHDSSSDSTASGTSTHYSTFRPGVETSGAYFDYSGKRYQVLYEKDGYLYYNENGVVKSKSVNEVTAYDATPCTAAVKSASLAQQLVDALSPLGVANRGSKDHNLYVTRWTNMPSVLVEVGFISNPSEISKIAAPSYQDQIAQKITQVVTNFFTTQI